MGQEVLNLIWFTMSGHGLQLYTAKQLSSQELSQAPVCWSSTRSSKASMVPKHLFTPSLSFEAYQLVLAEMKPCAFLELLQVLLPNDSVDKTPPDWFLFASRSPPMVSWRDLQPRHLYMPWGYELGQITHTFSFMLKCTILQHNPHIILASLNQIISPQIYTENNFDVLELQEHHRGPRGQAC